MTSFIPQEMIRQKSDELDACNRDLQLKLAILYPEYKYQSIDSIVPMFCKFVTESEIDYSLLSVLCSFPLESVYEAFSLAFSTDSGNIHCLMEKFTEIADQTIRITKNTQIIQQLFKLFGYLCSFEFLPSIFDSIIPIFLRKIPELIGESADLGTVIDVLTSYSVLQFITIALDRHEGYFFIQWIDDMCNGECVELNSVVSTKQTKRMIPVAYWIKNVFFLFKCLKNEKSFLDKIEVFVSTCIALFSLSCEIDKKIILRILFLFEQLNFISIFMNIWERVEKRIQSKFMLFIFLSLKCPQSAILLQKKIKIILGKLAGDGKQKNHIFHYHSLFIKKGACGLFMNGEFEIDFVSFVRDSIDMLSQESVVSKYSQLFFNIFWKLNKSVEQLSFGNSLSSVQSFLLRSEVEFDQIKEYFHDYPPVTQLIPTFNDSVARKDFVVAENLVLYLAKLPLRLLALIPNSQNIDFTLLIEATKGSDCQSFFTSFFCSFVGLMRKSFFTTNDISLIDFLITIQEKIENKEYSIALFKLNPELFIGRLFAKFSSTFSSSNLHFLLVLFNSILDDYSLNSTADSALIPASQPVIVLVMKHLQNFLFFIDVTFCLFPEESFSLSKRLISLNCPQISFPIYNQLFCSMLSSVAIVRQNYQQKQDNLVRLRTDIHCNILTKSLLAICKLLQFNCEFFVFLVCTERLEIFLSMLRRILHCTCQDNRTSMCKLVFQLYSYLFVCISTDLLTVFEERAEFFISEYNQKSQISIFLSFLLSIDVEHLPNESCLHILSILQQLAAVPKCFALLVDNTKYTNRLLALLNRIWKIYKESRSNWQYVFEQIKFIKQMLQVFYIDSLKLFVHYDMHDLLDWWEEEGYSRKFSLLRQELKGVTMSNDIFVMIDFVERCIGRFKSLKRPKSPERVDISLLNVILAPKQVKPKGTFSFFPSYPTLSFINIFTCAWNELSLNQISTSNTTEFILYTEQSIANLTTNSTS